MSRGDAYEEMPRVGDIMIPLEQYPYVFEMDSIRKAISVFESCQLESKGLKSLPRALLVFDADQNLVGAVRRRDILRGLEPRFLRQEPLDYRKRLFDVKVDPNLSELSYDRALEEMRGLATMPVKDIMKPVQVTIGREDHVLKAVYEMVSYGLTLLPVMDGQRVVGVLRTVDAFMAVSALLFAGDAPECEEDPPAGGGGGCRG